RSRIPRAGANASRRQFRPTWPGSWPPWASAEPGTGCAFAGWRGAAMIGRGTRRIGPMTRRIAPAISLTALILAACETAPPMAYQPVPGPRGVGFSEQRIEPGRYRIAFRGAPGASRAMVEDYALRRAADLTVAEGYDWFRVYDRAMTFNPPSGPQVGLSIG